MITKKKVYLLLMIAVVCMMAGCSGKYTVEVKGTYQRVDTEVGITEKDSPFIQVVFIDNRFDMLVDFKEYDSGYTRNEDGHMILVEKNQ